jgi:dihydropteroate synthase
MDKLVAKPLRLEFTGRIGANLKAFGLGPDELNHVETGVHPLVVALYNLPEALLSELQELVSLAGGELVCSKDGTPAGKFGKNVIVIGSQDVYLQLVEKLNSCPDPDKKRLGKELEPLIGFRRPGRWLLAGGRSLELNETPRLMGVLNLSPDSFYEGSCYTSVEAAVEKAVEMAGQGADIIDLGGESTRPGLTPVGLQEELKRVIPVVREISRALPETLISVDTYKSQVAREAVEAGAHIVNDISAGLLDEKMLPAVAETDVGYVMMHMRGEPRTMQLNTEYEDLMAELFCFLQEGLERADKAGISREHIVLDPGIGFGKSPAGNYEIISRLAELAPLGRPLLVGPSRKSFLALAGLESPGERLEGTLAACTVAVLAGADILRVHDIEPVRRAVAAASFFKLSAGLARGD